MILVTGGGSGGHFYPGLAAAEALLRTGAVVVYVGAEGGLEARLLPQSGLPYRLIPAGKLSREALRPGEGLKVIKGLWQARKILNELKPKAVLSTGGFAGFPLAFTAELRGIPVVVHEQNARPGLAVRWLMPRARRIALAVPVDLPKHLASKACVVGMPVREERREKQAAKIALGLDKNKPVILVLGGSQGSVELNTNLPAKLAPLLKDYQVLHQTGAHWEQGMREKYTHTPGYQVTGYLDTTLAWGAAEFAITRAGAATLAEAAFHQVPLLVIPLPKSLDGGAQHANAKFYAGRGAVLMLEHGYDSFDEAIRPLLDPARRAEMKKQLALLSPEKAAGRLAKLVLEVAA